MMNENKHGGSNLGAWVTMALAIGGALIFAIWQLGPGTLRNLAYILAEANRDLNDALKFARVAKEQLPEDANIMDTLGWVYYRRGLYDSAIAEFKSSLAKTPGNAAVIYHLGMAYAKKGDKEKALVELERAIALNLLPSDAHEAKKALEGLR